ncbi:MAG: LamG-like jellyroll fold domain-containing protein [Bacteroidota bacterium]
MNCDTYKNIYVRFLYTACFVCLSIIGFTQAPSISYGEHKLFTRDSAIGKIVPVNIGGEVPQTIYSSTTTFAGNGVPGSVDGKSSTATFNRPSKIAVDHLGNLYVADELNNKIRKITADGMVTTLAGSGKAGAENSLIGSKASFNRPGGIGVDKLGNVYVADVFNHKIRKITASGAVTTLAGNGHQGYVDDAKGLSAEFDFPVDVAVDDAGNVYVIDEGNNKIRKVLPNGAVSTFAGSGAVGAQDNRVGVLASFNQPNGIAVDQKGNVYVADQLNHKIRKITAAGVVTTFAGNGQAGSNDNTVGILAGFNNPRGVAVDRIGNVYVGDVGNQKIRKITQTGAVSTLSGSGVPGSHDNANGSLAEFYFPDGTAIDSLGNLYVADGLNNKIRKIETKGYSIIPELLPQGLYFDPATGIFSGTPTEDVLNSAYAITAYNTSGSSTANLTINVCEQPGNALSFDGQDDRVFVPDADQLRSPVVSVELWMNFKKMSGNFARILLKRSDRLTYDDSYAIGVDSLQRFRAIMCSGSGRPEGQKFATQKNVLIPGTWYYLSAVFSRDSVKLYVNGELQQATYTGFPISHGRNALSFGFDETMSFELDEVRIFNTNRSPFFVEDMHNILSPDTQGLVAYYNFNSGRSRGQNAGITTVVDLTSHRNNGVLTNFQLGGSSSNWIESHAMVAPVALEAEKVHSTGFTALWNKPRFGTTGRYMIDISTNSDFTSFEQDHHDKWITDTSQVVNGLKPGTVYYYRVRAELNADGSNGGFSNVIRVKTGL